MRLQQSLKGDLELWRDQSAELLGKQVILDGLKLPTDDKKDISLQTRGNIALAVSQIELFPKLVKGTRYYDRFHFDGTNQELVRNQQETFTFQGQGGNPAVSIVLSNEVPAIAVIKRLLTSEGEEITWAAALQKLGVKPALFNVFTHAADGIQTSSAASELRLEDLPQLDIPEVDCVTRPKHNISNLDSIMKLPRGIRTALRDLLPEILRSEQ